MTVAQQAITTSFTPPPAASIALTADSANAKMKIAAFLAAPASGAPVPSTVNILRRKGTDAFAALIANLTEPLPVTMATLTGFNAFRQLPDIPDVGTVHGWNLFIDGGATTDTGWTTVGGTWSNVADALSPSGRAWQVVATAGGQYRYKDYAVEAGRPYSVASQIRSDGTGTALIQMDWLDAAANVVGSVQSAAQTGTNYAEQTIVNAVAPGTARKGRVYIYITNGAGIAWFTAIRVKQQATAPLAWTAADQQVLGNQGIEIYEAGTNTGGADPDMEAVGTAAYTATASTLTKDTTTKFAGTQSLKVASTGVGGKASISGSLAAAQAITASVRYKGGDATGGLVLVSTPGGTTIGSSLGAATDWTARSVSGVIAGGDTGWRVDMIAGANTVVANFDNLWVANQAYDTGNADPSGLAYNTGARTASSVTETLPTGFDWTQGFAIVGTYRPDHAYNRGTPDRYVFELFQDANNRMHLILTSAGTLYFEKVRQGISAPFHDAAATAPAAGDTVAWGCLFIPGTGMYLVLSKNGGAVATYSLTSAEAQLATFAAGTPTLYIGRYGGGAGNECDGSEGITRIWTTVDSTTLAKVQAAVTGNAPYGAPTDSEAAVWAFNGQAYQVPVVDDHLLKLGTAYDYRGDVNSAGVNAATATGLVSTGTVVALGDSFWLKVPATPTLNLKLPVKYEVGLGYTVPRRSAALEPLSGAAKIVIQGPNAYGAEITLKLIYAGASGQDVTEAALTALLNLAADVWLQDIYGGLRKVKFPAIAYQHLATYMWVDFKLIEAA